VKDDFAVARRVKYGAVSLELAAKLSGIDQIPVVRQRQLSPPAIDKERLGVRERTFSIGRARWPSDPAGAPAGFR